MVSAPVLRLLLREWCGLRGKSKICGEVNGVQKADEARYGEVAREGSVAGSVAVA